MKDFIRLVNCKAKLHIKYSTFKYNVYRLRKVMK